MLTATNGAIEANKDDSKYPGKLMAAVGDTTKEINQQKKQGTTPTQNQIQVIFNQMGFQVLSNLSLYELDDHQSL